MLILNSCLDSYLFPYIGSKPIKSIRAQQLLTAIRRAEERGKNETAHRVRALAGGCSDSRWRRGGQTTMYPQILRTP